MANSYTEYTASSVTTSTQFATPSYITGRGATDISVTVSGVTQASSAYTLTGTNITFAADSLPTDGAKILITRTTSQNARINTYSENTILTPAQLNTDGDQSFMMAQEALEQASRTDFGAQTFYTSGTSAPSSALAGDLFFNTSTGLLQVYTGSAWESVNQRGSKQTFAISGSTTVFTPSNPVDANTLVFLNGVLLVKGSGSDGDYTTSSTQVTLNTAVTSGVVEIVTFPNSTNNTFTSGINVTGTVTADGLALGDGDIAGFGTSIDRGNNWNGVAQGNHFDLEIRHDGSNSYIKDFGTGNLAIEAADLALRDNSNNRRVFCTDGAAGSVELYYGDSSSGSKLNTTATGIAVTGTVTADALTMGDNEKITLGSGSDLTIHSDGTNSYITEKNTTGNLYIDTNHLVWRQGTGFPVGDDATPQDFNRLLATGSSAGGMFFYAGGESSYDSSDSTNYDPAYGRYRLHIKPKAGATTAGGADFYGKVNIKDATGSGTQTGATMDSGVSLGSGDLVVENNITVSKGDLTLTDASSTGTFNGNVDVAGSIKGSMRPNSSTETARTGAQFKLYKSMRTFYSGASTATWDLSGTPSDGDTWVIMNVSSSNIVINKASQTLKYIDGSAVNASANRTIASGGIAEIVYDGTAGCYYIFGDGIS